MSADPLTRERRRMSSTQQVLSAGHLVSVKGPPRPGGHRRLHGSDFTWAIAFVVPYAAVFVAFVVYPVGYALWMASSPSLYTDLIADPLYLTAVVNTLLFAGLGVNVKMFLALLLSGFFMRRRWWIKALLVIYIVPWLLAAVQAFISFHWMLIGELGFIDSLLSALFGIDGPIWFNNRWLALGSNIVAYIWKWMPFWTVIFLAGRMAIPRDIYDAAAVDGATSVRRFVFVIFPLLANLYLFCTLLSTIWTVGEFATVYFVSGGAPVWSTEVLATLGFHYTFDLSRPALGVAAMMSALPVLIPIVIALMRKLQTSELQL
jgi:multiple sugar transport system permease protein